MSAYLVHLFGCLYRDAREGVSFHCMMHSSKKSRNGGFLSGHFVRSSLNHGFNSHDKYYMYIILFLRWLDVTD